MIRKLKASAAALAAALLVIASTARGDAPAQRKYLRFVEQGDQRQLQTSIVHFKNAAGVRVDLIGAVHIADGTYFKQLNERFKQYDALLYEMVKPRGLDEAEIAGREPNGMISFLQHFMKDQLNLDFQLDRIDYTPKNFVHADLDAETFVKRQAERGENMFTLMLNSMMREMSRPPEDRAGAAAPIGIMDLVNALQSPDRGRQLKLVLGRQFEHMDEALDAMGGADGSVILDERNKHALKVLKEQIDAGKTHLGIFYGAGHMKGMEELMTDLMGFKQVGDPEWLVAWDMSEPQPAKAIEPASPTTRPAAALPSMP